MKVNYNFANLYIKVNVSAQAVTAFPSIVKASHPPTDEQLCACGTHARGGMRGLPAPRHALLVGRPEAASAEARGGTTPESVERCLIIIQCIHSKKLNRLVVALHNV